MKLRNSPHRFGLVANLLHWVIVAGIITQYFLAEAAEDNDASASALTGMGLHRSIGFTILVLAVARLAWRMFDAPPAWPNTMKPLARTLASTTHIAFYVLLFALPLSGWAVSSAEGDPLSMFGLFSFPPLTFGEAMEDTFEEVHEILFNVLIALGLLHILAALKHQFIDRDGVLRRMLPGSSE